MLWKLADNVKYEEDCEVRGVGRGRRGSGWRCGAAPRCAAAGLCPLGGGCTRPSATRSPSVPRALSFCFLIRLGFLIFFSPPKLLDVKIKKDVPSCKELEAALYGTGFCPV